MVVGLEDRNQVELLILEPTLDRWRNGRIDNDSLLITNPDPDDVVLQDRQCVDGGLHR